MELEWHQIELRYQRLHLPDRKRERRLALGLVEYGQQNPVVVVQSEGRYVLIDGYLRAAVLPGHPLRRVAPMQRVAVVTR